MQQIKLLEEWQNKSPQKIPVEIWAERASEVWPYEAGATAVPDVDRLQSF